MANKPFRYSIKFNGLFYIGKSGVVTTSASPHYYYSEIGNWEDIVLTDVRNLRMSGFYRSYTEELQFVKDMAAVLRHIYFNYGRAAKVTVYIDRFNLSTFYYETFTDNQVEFSTAQFEKLQVTAMLTQNGVHEKIKTREEVEYRIPMTAANGLRRIKKQPRKVKGRSIFITANDELSSGNRTGDDFNWPQILFHEDDYLQIAEAVGNRPVDYMEPTAPTYIRGQQRNELGGLGNYVGYLLTSNVDLTNVTLSLGLPTFIMNKDVSNSISLTLKIMRADNQSRTGGGANWIEIAASNVVTLAANTQTNATFTISSTFDLPKDKVIHLIIERSGVSTNFEYNWQQDIVFYVDYQYYTSGYSGYGIPWFSAFKSLITQITDGEADAKSDLLTIADTYLNGIDLRADRLALLSGGTIKGKSNQEAKISLKDFLKATDVMLCAGIGIEYNSISGRYDVRLEKRSRFFKEYVGDTPASGDNTMMTLSTITNSYMFENATELIFSNVHIGYQTKDKDDVNGKEDYNTSIRMQVAKDFGAANELSLISPVSASGDDMYRVWVKYTVDPEKDNGGDDELFVVQYATSPSSDILGIYYNALYPYAISPSYYITGVTDPARALNTGLTPKKCYERYAQYLLSMMLHDNDPDVSLRYLLKYQTMEKNKSFASRISTTHTITEAQDERVDVTVSRQGKARLFYPITLTVETNAPKDYKVLTDINKYGVIKQVIGGISIKGFPLEMSESGVKPVARTYKQLLTAGNSLETIANSNIFEM